MDKKPWESKKAWAFFLGLIALLVNGRYALNVGTHIVALVLGYSGAQGYVDAKQKERS